MWAGRLGWPPHPCPCRSALQKLQPKLALRFRPHVAAVQTDHRRAHAADLHACAEPFYDSAWLSNSSSPSLSAGEWDKTPLPAHSPICRCSGMCNKYKISLLDVDTSGAQKNSGGSRGGNYPLAVTFCRDIGTCQYPGGRHKYQSQCDDECNENPGVAQALFGFRLEVVASLDLTCSLDRAGRRAANLNLMRLFPKTCLPDW